MEEVQINLAFFMKKKDWKELPEGKDRYRAYIRSSEWDDVRKIIIDRDGHHCMCCGRSEDECGSLTVHHNSYEFLYHELDHSDCLISVCRTCHSSIHRNRSNWSRFRMG